MDGRVDWMETTGITTTKDGTELAIDAGFEERYFGPVQEYEGILLPQEFRVVESLARDRKHAVGDAYLNAEYMFSMIDGVPRCIFAGVRADFGSPREVRASDLREVRIEYVLEAAILHLSRFSVARQVLTAETRSLMKRRGTVSNQTLQEVAKVYEDHVDDAPTQAVADHFGIQLRTASLRVKRAREAGYITKTAKAGRRPQT